LPQKKHRRVKGEGSIFQRADGLWVSKYKGKVLYSHNSYDASDNLQILENNAKITKLEFSPISASQIMQKFLLMKVSSLKPASRDRMESTILCQINPRIGSHDASTLTADEFFKLVLDKMRAEGLSYSSIKKAYDTFNAGMRYGFARKMIERNPLEGCDAPTQNAYHTVGDDIDNNGSLLYIPPEKLELFVAAVHARFSNGCIRLIQPPKTGPATMLGKRELRCPPKSSPL